MHSNVLYNINAKNIKQIVKFMLDYVDNHFNKTILIYSVLRCNLCAQFSIPLIITIIPIHAIICVT